MKLLKLFFLLAFVSTFTACGDDEEGSSCVQSDWVGTYTGSSDCQGLVEDVTVTITASGTDAVIIEYETATQDTEYDQLTFDGCNIERNETVLGNGSKVEITLDGDNLTLNEEITVLGVSATCDITATRN